MAAWRLYMSACGVTTVLFGERWSGATVREDSA